MSEPQQIFAAIAAGVANAPERGLALLQPIVDRGPRPTYALLCSLAEAASHTAREQPGDFFGIELESVTTGEPGSIEELPPQIRFAAQFVTAWANRDHDTAHGLFTALAATEHLATGIGAVYDMAVATARNIVDAQRQGRP
ncbi:hypothetical protein [Streptomyces nanshensis]|uniref:Uncharacterized protein n=1 Tax=Streptomyces nanshensis TaxID=518642 RepID=A0A1E7KZE4_9ACTN|nr:hypothetical protein [Streptomyces nanshensis]OEV09328.1 hypothetical protein AN218_23150 [Streptomyces nanshensis]